MKKLLRPLFATLLAFAMLLPGGAALAAADTATKVTLTPAATTLYLHEGKSPASVTITAAVTPKDFTGKIVWTINDANNVLRVLNEGTAAITVEPAGYDAARKALTGTATITATVTNADKSTVSGSAAVTVREDVLKTVSLSLNRSSINVGASAQATVSAAYESGVAPDASEITYASSDENVARVSDAGRVTGVSAGSARITATVGGKSASATVTVSSTAVTDTADAGGTLSMRKVYDALRDRFYSAYGASPSSDAHIMFTFTPGSKNFGALFDKARREIYQDDLTILFSELETMYLDAYAEGTFSFSCTITDGGRSLTNDVSISIEKPTKYIRVAITSDDNYSFSSQDTGGRTGVQLIGDAVGSFGSIRFGSILSGENVGTLYTSSRDLSSATRVGRNTIVTSAEASDLYFTPSRAGTYRIEYDTYSNSEARGSSICSGELIIAVDTGSLNVTVNLEDSDPYTFSNSSRTSNGSAASQLINTINDTIGSAAWNYIRFDTSTIGTNAIGTLHATSSTRREIASTDYILYSDISDLYFVPSRTGAFEIEYGAYADNTSNTPLVTGKLRIVVSNVPTGTADISYTTAVGGQVSFSEEDFVRFYQNKRGSRYYLAYVRFDDYNGDGSFYHDAATFVPYNSADCYTRDYTGKLPNSPKYLDRISFTAPRDSGFTAVKFTCYGGTYQDSSNIQQSGVLYIFYTANDVPDVAYNAYGVSSVSLRESDFADAYRTAMRSAASNPQFSIRLLTAPASGLLYQTYPNSSSSSRLTENNISNYSFTVGGSNTRTSVNTISYTPLSTSTGSDSVIYIAYDNDGLQLYTGSIRFKLAADRTVSAASDGYVFQLTDFYSLGDRDPVLSVTFREPAEGKLYVQQDSRFQAVSAATSFYTISTANGTYPVSALRYVPKAGQTGAVTLTYTATRQSGAKFDNSLIVSPMSKTASARFGDVASAGGWSWAVDAVDFASSFGLVNGTGNDASGRAQFSPSSTMRRCDLVLILYRLAGSPAVSGTLPFSDVVAQPKPYYYDSAVWAYQRNILNGVVTGGLYNPNGAITRQDFATILYNYTNAMGVSTANTGTIQAYADASQVSAYAVNAVTWAVSKGYITSASSALTIAPTDTANRAQIATLLHRYLTY